MNNNSIRIKLLNRLIKKAKTTEMAMIGIDISKHKLSNIEKRYLVVDKGLHLTEARYRQLILTYPQKLRANDLRNKIINKEKSYRRQ